MGRIFWATYYSWRGFISAVKYEAAFRQELILVLLMLPFAFWLGDGAVEHFLLIGSGLLVLIVELLNSAIEAAVDRIGTERHRLSGQAKDMGSAAVFLSLVLMAICWIEIALF
ncbi:diacylglycerol kinase [Desulforhopalus vacuolatus]|uniref:diacylglycerol kinase n=1 Tax=Desulforhopalus vacuolatus TaxID=40414 RepID=UPI001964AB78|nr:diacylglycerol kinase [Desulforhopalus vacuolatus]MBM9519424.1 diacylglycerol kinase [Desulforhopalus vacuolatus]